MTALIRTFATSESGAVTVDWVVLTAALVGLAIAVLGVVSVGVEDLARDTTAVMEGDVVSQTFGDDSALGLE